MEIGNKERSHHIGWGLVMERGGDWMAGTTVSSQFSACLPVARNHSQHKKTCRVPQSDPALTQLHGNQHGRAALLSSSCDLLPSGLDYQHVSAAGHHANCFSPSPVEGRARPK